MRNSYQQLLIEQLYKAIDINNFNSLRFMEEQQDLGSKPSQYFKNIAQKSHYNKSLDQVLKQAEQNVQTNIEGGKIQLEPQIQNDKKQEVLDNLLKKKQIDPFESRYRGFLLNSDRQKSQERFEVFKKLKQEYSKEKTAIVVKDVESKIKQWTDKKLQIDLRRQRSNQKKKRIQQELREERIKKEEQQKKLEAFQRKQELIKRRQQLERRREERERFMKESEERSKHLKSPKYKDIEQKFKQIQAKMKEERQKILIQKKHAQSISKDQLKQHKKKYKLHLKEKEEDRKKKAKYKIDEDHKSLVQREDFDTFTHDHKTEKETEQKKRKRRKQFQEKVRSMANLSKREKTLENDESLQKSREKSLDKSESRNKLEDSRQGSILNSRKKRIMKRDLNETANPRKLGNQYLHQLRSRDNKSLRKSLSLPKINQETPGKPLYKNYLTDAKLHLKKKGLKDEIEQVKKQSKSRSEVFQKLNKKSQGYESNMIRKIMELSKLNKYDDSVKKESEIDDLHAKYIKTRLACID